MSDNDVWVELEVLKGPMVSVYRGRMERGAFEAWRTGEPLRGAIALHDAYWSYDDPEGHEGWVVVGATAGPYANARGTIHVRADLVVVVVPLQDGFEREAHRARPTLGGARDDDG